MPRIATMELMFSIISQSFQMTKLLSVLWCVRKEPCLLTILTGVFVVGHHLEFCRRNSWRCLIGVNFASESSRCET